ncbi:MAG: glycosyltransferase [Anaerolineae bacterium]|nr:glycosyltransferase [Anaerolineae bacterium]
MNDLKAQLQSLIKQTEPTQRHVERARIIKSLVPGGSGGIGAEIGVYKGQLIRPVVDIVRPKKLHVIDPWYLLTKRWTWGEESRSTMRALMAIIATYEDELVSGQLAVHVGSSFDVLANLPDDYFDWVYLDTVHTYEHTLKELALLKVKVKESGVIIGDDWYPDPDKRHHGVYQAVNEFVEVENYELIYESANNTQWAIRQKGASNAFVVPSLPSQEDAGERTAAETTLLYPGRWGNRHQISSEEGGKLAIICRPRTGSNHLVALLNSHPDICCHHEVFHQKGVFTTKREGDITPTIEERDADPIGTLEYLAAEALKEHKIYCFKLFPHQSQEVLEYVLTNEEWDIIWLDRLNKLLQFASSERAEITGAYTWKQLQETQPELDPKTIKIEFDPDKFKTYLRHDKESMTPIIDMIENTDKDYIHITYEELCEVGADRIMSLLGFDDDVALKSVHKKLGPARVADSFSNYSDVVDFIRNEMPQYADQWLDQEEAATVDESVIEHVSASPEPDIKTDYQQKASEDKTELQQEGQPEAHYTFGCNITTQCEFTSIDVLTLLDNLVTRDKPRFSYKRIGNQARFREGTKIAVISWPRSGSNHFVSLLNSHPGIECHGELYNPNGVWTRPQKETYTIEERDADPIRFLEELAAKTLNRNKLFGFKLLAMQNQAVFDYVVSNDEWVIILLDRSNTLLQYASHQRAQSTGVYTWQDKQRLQSNTKEVTVKIEFDPQEFRDYLLYKEEHLAPVVDLIENTNRDYIYTTYEELTSIGVDRVLAALGLHCGVTLRSKHRKTGPSKVSDSFSNYPEVVDFVENEMPEYRKPWLDQEYGIPSFPTLLLMEKREPQTKLSTWNYIEQHNLQHHVDLIPYYDSSSIPDPRSLCDVWFSKNNSPATLNMDHLADVYAESRKKQPAVLDDGYKHVLYFTSFHPLRKVGNSVIIKDWMDHLIKAGYVVHLVYYAYDAQYVTPEMHNSLRKMVPYYTEIPVKSRLVGHNLNGLNVHTDDWCGVEVVDTVKQLCDQFEFEMGVVHYPFFSKVLEVMPESTRKILHTHDRFANRNRRMLEQGYPQSGWVSLTDDGEALACQRADVVVAIQEQEAQYFKEISQGKEVVVVSPVFPRQYLPRRNYDQTLRIGYFGSANWLNEQNLADYMNALVERKLVGRKCELIVAGNLCSTLHQFVDDDVLRKVQPQLMGRVDDLADFFAECDIIVNPERGGTGMKIKTVETLSYGKPLLATTAGMAGLTSDNKYHNAPNIEALADLTQELIENPHELQALSQLSQELYEGHFARQEKQLSELFGYIEADFGELDYVRRDPKVSIIVPYYNVENYLDECIKSVLRQDYQNWELILVDDASDDNSRAIALHHASSDSRINLVTHEHNQGLGPARNTGVLYASGEFILFLDSDDLLKKNALSSLVDAALRYQTPVVIGSGETIDEFGHISPLDRDRDKNEPRHFGKRDSWQACLQALGASNESYIPMRAWGILIDRALWLRFNIPFPPFEHEDIPVIPFLYKQAGELAYIEDVVVSYRVRTQSLSRTPWDEAKIDRHFSLWQLIKERADQFGLSEHSGQIALSYTYHLLWRIKNYGFEADATEKLLNTTGEMVSFFVHDGNIDQRHKVNIIKDTVRVLEAADTTVDRDLQQRLIDCFGLELITEYYKVEMEAASH